MNRALKYGLPITIFVLAIIFYLYQVGTQVENNKTQMQIKIVKYKIEQAAFINDSVPYDAIRAAVADWERVNPQLSFKAEDNNPDVILTFVKDFGGYTLGEAIIKGNWAVVGIGDSNCLNRWQQYDRTSIELIAAHEIGHILGLNHSTNPNDIMYPTINKIKYETDVEETTVLAPNYVQFYPVCSRMNVSTYSFQVLSEKSVNVYVIPSQDDYNKFINSQEFNQYVDCTSKEATFFNKQCTIETKGGIIISNPSTTESTKIDVTIKEK